MASDRRYWFNDDEQHCGVRRRQRQPVAGFSSAARYQYRPQFIRINERLVGDEDGGSADAGLDERQTSAFNRAISTVRRRYASTTASGYVKDIKQVHAKQSRFLNADAASELLNVIGAIIPTPLTNGFDILQRLRA